MAIVHGTDNDDILNAADGVTNGDDQVHGQAGVDELYGLGGNDELWAGPDSDLLIGGAGADYLNGGTGMGFNIASYQDAPTGVFVSLLTETGISGYAAGDKLVNIHGLRGSDHDDILVGGNIYSYLDGGDGNDQLRGGSGDSQLFAGYGDDTLKGGGGADELRGGPGLDTADYRDSSQAVVVSLFNGFTSGGDAAGDEFIQIENLTGSDHDDGLVGSIDANVLKGGIGNDELKGIGGADKLYGESGNDTLGGGEGIDWLVGGTGHDKLDGGTGNDTMNGGANNDTYYVDGADVIAGEVVNGGVDKVLASASYTLTSGQSVELLATTDADKTASINLVGNGVKQTITGNAGNNVLIGGGGVDKLVGLDGNDAYTVDSSTEVVVEASGKGTDNVNASTSYVLAAGVSAETLRTIAVAGISPFNLTGNEIAQAVTGNSGANVLNGKGGNDTITANAGSDTIVFDTKPDAATNMDTVVDYSSLADVIHIDNAVFAAVGGTGTLAAAAWYVNKGGTGAAHDADDRIIYDFTNGGLYYDADGTGAGAGVKFAQLAAGLSMTSSEFVVI